MLRAQERVLNVGSKLSDVYTGRALVPGRGRSVHSVAYSAAVMADVPKGFWKCDEASGNLADSSGNAFTLTADAGLTYQETGPFGCDYSIQFNVKKASRTSITSVTGTLTMEAWVKWNALNSNSIFGNNNGGTNGYELTMQSSKLQAVCQGVGFLQPSGQTLTTGVWHHIVFQRLGGAGTVWRYYMDGQFDMSNCGTTNPIALSSATTTINRDTGSNINVAYYAIYETALTPARILAHYNAGVLL